MLPSCHGDLQGGVGAKLHNLIYSRVVGGSRGLQGSFSEKGIPFLSASWRCALGKGRKLAELLGCG